MGYRINKTVVLHWHALEEDYIVFDETSGQTHQLDAIRAFVLSALQESDLSAQAIFKALDLVIKPEAETTLEVLAQEILNEFVSHGLAEVQTP
jgi:PqqD family protein of HPr-rel-A system